MEFTDGDEIILEGTRLIDGLIEDNLKVTMLKLGLFRNAHNRDLRPEELERRLVISLEGLSKNRAEQGRNIFGTTAIRRKGWLGQTRKFE